MSATYDSLSQTEGREWHSLENWQSDVLRPNRSCRPSVSFHPRRSRDRLQTILFHLPRNPPEYLFQPSHVSGKLALKATKSHNTKTAAMRLGVRVGRGANMKQTMFCYNVYYMFLHSSSLQGRHYFCAFFRRARR